MNKTELDQEEPANKQNRLSWKDLGELPNDKKKRLINEHGCILIFDSKFMQIYRIESVEL